MPIKIKKFFIAFTAAVMAFAAVPFINAEAGTQKGSTNRTIKVQIKKEFEQGTFDVTVNGGGKYKVTITAPKSSGYDDDTVYTCSKIDSSLYRKTIESMGKGTWKVKVKAIKGKIKGNVKVTFNSNPTPSTDIIDNIKVGKNISGLEYYMSDRTLHIDWTDETVGTVNITVTNVDNNEQIDSKSVDGMEYNIKIPDNIFAVSVSIVPATSADIDGAAKVFNVDVEHTFLANVLYTKRTATNENSTVATVKFAQDGYGLIVDVNDKEVLNKGSLSQGEYDITIPLDDSGKNKVTVYVVDKDGNRKSYSKTLFKDTTPPDVKFSKNYDKMSVANGKFTIEGRILDYKTFKVNNTDDVDVAEDGHFSYPVVIHNGANEYDFVAIDDAGNKTTYNMVITGGGKSSSGGSSKGLLWLLVLIIGGVIIHKVNKKKKLMPEAKSAGDSVSKAQDILRQKVDNIRKSVIKDKGDAEDEQVEILKPVDRNMQDNNARQRTQKNMNAQEKTDDFNIRRLGDLMDNDDEDE